MTDQRCMICGHPLDIGITIWLYEDGYAHPECVQGKQQGRFIPIDEDD